MGSDDYRAQYHAGLWACLDELPVAAMVQDSDGVVRWLNPAAAALLDIRQHLGIGRTCRDLLGCSECEWRCAATQAREHQQAQAGFDVRLQLPDGTRLPASMDAVPIREGLVVILLHEVLPDGLLDAYDLRKRCAEIMKSWTLPG